MEEKCKLKGYKRLIVFQKADKLAHEIYSITKEFPKEEIYNLTSQIKRAALSIPTNIVEGYARHNDKYLKYFFGVAYSSCVETNYLLDFATKEGFINKNQIINTKELISEVEKILWSFLNKIQKDIK